MFVIFKITVHCISLWINALCVVCRRLPRVLVQSVGKDRDVSFLVPNNVVGFSLEGWLYQHWIRRRTLQDNLNLCFWEALISMQVGFNIRASNIEMIGTPPFLMPLPLSLSVVDSLLRACH